MKSKALLLISTLLMALALMAQSTTQTTPPVSGDNAKCACCNDGGDAKMCCSGRDTGCCAKGECCPAKDKGKDGKMCPMMSKDDNAKSSCCSGSKCAMHSDAKGHSCCGGKMCQRPQPAA